MSLPPLTLSDQLNALTREAFFQVIQDDSFGAVTLSTRPEMADFQCNGAMAASKKHGKKPRDLSHAVVTILRQNPIASVEMAGPGFINFRIRPEALACQFNALKAARNFFFEPIEIDRKVIIDYGGPNAAKAMHVGHLRSAVIGQSLKNILNFAGYSVIGDIHMGDWGLQMGQLICEIEDRFPEWGYFSTNEEDYPKEPAFNMDDLLVWYPVASARSKDDEAFKLRSRKATAELQSGHRGYRALWQHMVDVSISDIRHDYNRLGIDFEQWFGESRYQDRLGGLVERIENASVLEESEGALIVRCEGNLPPLTMRNSDGGYGYASTDIATIDERIAEFDADEILYVVDKRQSTHFAQVFDVVRRTGISGSAVLEHLPFGTVNGKDGKPFKTREGGVMRLNDLISMMVEAATSRLATDSKEAFSDLQTAAIANEVGLAAVKFGDLYHDRERDYIFDLDNFIQFEGNTGPYLQYTCVRIMSLLRRGTDSGILPSDIEKIDDGASQVIILLDNFKHIIKRTVEKKKPHILANHLLDIANAYNAFYSKNRVFGTDIRKADSSARLGIALAAKKQIELGLNLLGINVPERM